MQDFFYWVKASIINIQYRRSRKKPLNLPITSFFGSNAIINTKAAKTSIHKISLLKISKSSITIGLIIAVIPRTDPILKIFEPIKLPREIPFSPLEIAIRDVASSGILVPIAIKDTEITASLIQFPEQN